MSSSTAYTDPPPPFKITPSTRLEDWKKWQRSFRYYSSAINLGQESHDDQLRVFKSLLGPEGLEIYNTFSILEITDVESVIRKFDDHFKPKANVTLERYKLYKLHQKSGQTFDDYLTDIINQVDKCEFKSMRDEIVLYKIIGGIENDELRSALLAATDLKYEKAVQMCRASAITLFLSGKNPLKGDTNKVEVDKSTEVTVGKRSRKKRRITKSQESHAGVSKDSKEAMMNNENGVSDGGDSDWRCDDDDDAEDDDYKPLSENGTNRQHLKKPSARKNGKARRRTVTLHTCDVCFRTVVGSRKDLSRHLITHADVERVICHHCGGRFKQKRYLLRHMVRAHPDVIGSTGPQIHICDVCGYKTNNGANMRRHKFKHTEDKPFSCELCEYKCIVPHLMKVHMAKHTGETLPFVCSVCQKGFAELWMLKKHVRMHMTPEEREKHLAEERMSSSRRVGGNTTCETCGKVFSSRGALKTHSVVHTGDRPHACPYCDYRAGQRAALKTHMVIHSDEKPFVCSVCGFSCKLKRILLNHMNIHTGDRPYACNMCDSKFKQWSHLTVHLRTHTGEKPYVCDICGHRWAKQSNLTQHMKVHQNQTGDPSQYTPPRKRQKKRKVATPPTDPVPPPGPAPASAIPQWSEQVSTINPMECFLTLETSPPFHPTYPTPQGEPRPPDCRYFQQRQ